MKRSHQCYGVRNSRRVDLGDLGKLRIRLKEQEATNVDENE
jgi:hypothetical protein